MVFGYLTYEVFHACEHLPAEHPVARAIVRAASQASKAADYLLGFVPGSIEPASLDSAVADHETA